MDVDASVCGLLCQHPSCWESQKRQSRGQCHYTHRPEPEAISDQDNYDDDEGLPTQNVINLLKDYGDDPQDRYPFKYGVQKFHPPSSTSSNSNRSTGRSSFSKMKTPMVTPASLLQSSSINIGHMTPPQAEPSPPQAINKVEVQEVFDLDDLRSDWHDTFVARQFYVWMPNPNAVKKNVEQTNGIQQGGQLTESTGSVLPRDVTELMVPREIGWERTGHKMRRNIGSPKTPQQGLHSYSRGSFASKSPKEYYGIYELLDLPRDVLVKVLDHVDRRDLVDRERLTEALTRAFPKLERENSSLSMAYGDVLQQHKINLHDDRPLRPRPVHITGIGSSLPTKQVYLLDVGTSSQSRRICLPPDVRPKAIVSPHPPDKQKPSGAHRSNKDQSKHHLPKKAPLPSIPSEHDSSSNFCTMASVSLGLPQLPSGVKITRPFNYKQQFLDFTLGPVPQPLLYDRIVTRGQRAAVGYDRQTSPGSSDHTSNIVVTMPTMPADQVEAAAAAAAAANKKREVTSASKSEDDLPEGPRPLHAVSPSYSTNVPKAPAGTPSIFRQSSSGLTKDGTPSPPKTYHDAYDSPLGGAHNSVPVTGVAIHKPVGVSTPEAPGILDTIRESEPDEQTPQPADYRLRAELSKSRRSVRFAADIPCQPPSSPNSSDRSESPLTHRGHYGGESVTNNPSSTSPDILTVHGGKSAQSRTGSLPTSMDTRTISPDTWPQVNEDSYNKTPTPPTTALTESTPAELDQSIVGQYDLRSEPSDLVLQSRESSFHSSKKVLMLRECLGESPGPPPPSPEAKDPPEKNIQEQQTFQVPPLAQSSGSNLVESSVNIDDLVDSDSEMTLSAKPPSNLDDISRIQTPSTPQRTDRSGITGNNVISQSHEVIPEVATVMEESPECSSALPPGGEQEPHKLITPVDITITPGTRPSTETPDIGTTETQTIRETQNEGKTEATDKEATEITDKEATEATDKEATEATDNEATEITDKEATEATDKEATETTDKEATETTDKAATETTDKEATETTDKEATETTEKEATETSDKEATEATDKEATETTDNEATETTDKEATEATDKEATETSDKEATETTDKEATEATDKEATETTDKEATETTDKEATETTDKEVTETSDNVTIEGQQEPGGADMEPSSETVDIQPQQPVYSQQGSQQGSQPQDLRSTKPDEDAEIREKLAQLDQFQSNDDTFKEELKEELDRLSSEDQEAAGQAEKL